MENLYLRMKWNVFDQGYRLDKMIAGLSGTQQIFDGVYKGVIGKDRLSKKDREHYKLVAYEVQNNCLLATLGAILTVQQNLPGIADSYDGLWKHVKETFFYIYQIYSANKSENTCSITPTKDNKVVVVNNGGTNTTNIYNGYVVPFSKHVIPGLQQLDDTLEDGAVDSIELGAESEKEPAIVMPLKEKGLYYSYNKVDSQLKTLHCDIYDFNKYEKDGLLKVSAGQELPEGKYKFRVRNHQKVEDYILSMTSTDVEVCCLVSYEHDPLKGINVEALHIMSVVTRQGG